MCIIHRHTYILTHCHTTCSLIEPTFVGKQLLFGVCGGSSIGALVLLTQGVTPLLQKRT